MILGSRSRESDMNRFGLTDASYIADDLGLAEKIEGPADERLSSGDEMLLAFMRN